MKKKFSFNQLVLSEEQIPHWGVFFILTAIVLIVFGRSLFFQFVWDDGYLIINNPYIKDVRFIGHLFQGDLMASTTTGHYLSGYYRPVSMLSFMLDYFIWGTKPFGFHLTNLAFHLMNAFLGYLLIWQLSRKKVIAFWSAVVFAVHPIHIEAVVPVYNRMGLLTVFFSLLALLCFVGGREKGRGALLVGSLFLYGVALLSKENAIVLPLLFVAYDILFYAPRESKKKALWKVVAFYVFLILMVGLYFWIRAHNITRPLPSLRAAYPSLNYFSISHIATVISIFYLSIYKLLIPYPLIPVYWINIASFLDWKVIVAIIMLIGSLWGIYAFRRKRPLVSYFLVFFFVTLLPYLNIIPIAEVYTFRERFLYWPSLAFCFLMVYAIYSFFNRIPARNFAWWKGVLLGLTLVAGIYTVLSQGFWRNNLALWKKAVRYTPNSQLVLLNLGEAYLQENNLKEARRFLEKSLTAPMPKALNSIYLAQVDIATVDISLGQLQSAEKILEEAIKVGKAAGLNLFAVYDKMGLIYAIKKQPQKAEEFFLKALKSNPNFVTSLYNLGLLYYSQQDYNKAEDYLKRVVALKKDFEVALYALGFCYWEQKKFEEAKSIFARIIRLNPHNRVAKAFFSLLLKDRKNDTSH